MIEIDLGSFAVAQNSISVFGQMVTLLRGTNQNIICDRRGFDEIKLAVREINNFSSNADLPVIRSFSQELLSEIEILDKGDEQIEIAISGINLRFAASVIRLQEAIKTEVAGRIFLGLGADVTLWSPSGPIFGKAVYEAFPSAREDISEAAKCIAVERATACVMHLMRANEVPLKVLAGALDIGTQNDWGSYIREIGKTLESRMKSAGKRLPDEIFYAEAAETFERVKRAWRNRTMHVDQTYTVERAQKIFDATRDFMGHLAERLSE